MIYYATDYEFHTSRIVCSSCKKSWSDKTVPEGECPFCHEKTIAKKVGNIPYRTRYEDFTNVDPKVQVIDETTIQGKVHVANLTYSRETQMLKIDKVEVREFFVALLPTPHFELKVNGTPISSTKSNAKKVMAYTSYAQVPNTIFSALNTVYKKEGSSSLGVIFEEIMKNPWIEKIYNAGDKKLALYHILIRSAEMIDENESSIIKALHLNRSLFSFFIQYGYIFRRSNIDWEMVMCFIDRYNLQVAESIFRQAVEVYLSPRCVESHGKNLFLKRYFSLLLGHPEYDYKALANYLMDHIYTYQGIEHPEEGAQLLIDYIDMCQDMNVPFEKYPRSLKLVHDIAAKNKQEIINEKMKEEFQKAVGQKEYKTLQYSGKDYMVIAPEIPDDLVAEGAALSHCVGSYIDKVINRTARILFMRDKTQPKKALVTLDVRNGMLYQAAGFGNREITKKEQAFISVWGKKNHIDCSAFC